MINLDIIYGSWRAAPPSEPAVQEPWPHAYFFSAQGVLIQSTLTGATPERALLTWREEGGLLVIDQPSSPREERLSWQIASEQKMCIDGGWYVREKPGEESDPDAAEFALVAGALWQGVKSADAEGPFIPFLMLEVGMLVRVERIVTQDIAEADAHVMRRLAMNDYRLAIWVRDGSLVSDEGKVDAVLGALFKPGAVKTQDYALRYVFERDGKARATGGLVMQQGT